MELFTIEFWVAFQMLIDLVLVILILYLLKNIKSGMRKDVSMEASEHVIGMIEPLLKEADSTAEAFESQLREKNRLISRLNERLDSRIISLNLLLNRSEAYLADGSENVSSNRRHVYDQQEAILGLYNDGFDADNIAEKLSMPKGEVELVLDLKKKFSRIEAS